NRPRYGLGREENLKAVLIASSWDSLPFTADENKMVYGEAHKRKQGQQHETKSVTARRIFDQAEFERREKPAQSAEGPDQARDRSCFSGKVLGHQFKHGAVAETERSGGPKRADGEKRDVRKA